MVLNFEAKWVASCITVQNINVTRMTEIRSQQQAIECFGLDAWMNRQTYNLKT